MITFADDVLAYVREQHFSVGNVSLLVSICV